MVKFKPLLFTLIITSTLILLSCETRYKSTLYVNRSVDYTKEIISNVYNKLNLGGSRNIFSYKIQENIITENTPQTTNYITGLEISSTEPAFLPLVKTAFLQEIYLREKGPIPKHSIETKSFESFFVLNIILPGYSLLYGMERNILYSINFDSTKISEADAISSSSMINTFSEIVSIITLGILIEALDKFTITYLLLKPTSSFDTMDYILISTDLLFRILSLGLGIDLISKHNIIVNSGYNVDPTFPTSKLFKENEYPLFEVRFFRILF